MANPNSVDTLQPSVMPPLVVPPADAQQQPSSQRPNPPQTTIGQCIMENGESRLNDSKDRIMNVYSDFMMRVTIFEEFVSMGNKLLVGFQQALGFLRRTPIDKAATSVELIIKAHSSRRVLSYIEAGCVNSYDTAENVSNEIDDLLDDAASLVQTAKGKEEDENYSLNSLITSSDEEEVVLSNPSTPQISDYAMMMAIVYGMVKQDYTMQVHIVSSLNHKSSSGEMETYCQMWSLRPFVDDDVMQEAWKLVSSRA